MGASCLPLRGVGDRGGVNQRGMKQSGGSEYWSWPLVLLCKGYLSQILVNTACIGGQWHSRGPPVGHGVALVRRLQPGRECATSSSGTPPGPCVRGWGSLGTSCGAPGVLWSAPSWPLVEPRVCPWVAVGVSCGPEGPRQAAGGPRRARTALQALRESPRGAPRSLGGKLSGCSVVAWGVRWGSRFLFAFGSLG